MTDARSLLDEYATNGRLSPETVAQAKFGAISESSPALVISCAYALWVTQHLSGAKPAPASVGEVVADLLSADLPLSAEDAVTLTMVLLGEASFGMEAESDSVGGLEATTALLWSAVRRDGLREDEVDALLSDAEAACREVVDSAELMRPLVRDGAHGPWDATEPFDPQVRRLALGALRVPDINQVTLRPEQRGQDVEAVTFIFEKTALQLQLFHAAEGGTWDDVRGRLSSQVLTAGGQAEEKVGALGKELDCMLPVRDGSGRLARVRFLGCHGPGWLLRGVLRGDAAESDVHHAYVRHLFLETVVDLTSTPVAKSRGSAVPLRWPPR
ncbi:DUF3710 domain-containing protein [Streptomyces sp. WMMC500]|uniref:DUF3710 domain-containing protein n=1 Tax=Streptomyces sp. WMMC500 TaxID=3015154 RepID=UPI00248B45CF|nr:DUF3710 domain-containing protein [Streptomyces sp. WMMC500]WBB58178.1 DUF3710 domain-containing protein [Streptomyces sp. WMMC500]